MRQGGGEGEEEEEKSFIQRARGWIAQHPQKRPSNRMVRVSCGLALVLVVVLLSSTRTTEQASSMSEDNTFMAEQVELANQGIFPDNEKPSKFWRVVFLGSYFTEGRGRKLAGCPAKCPMQKNCHLTYTNNLNAASQADVVVVYQEEWQLAYKTKKRVKKDAIHVVHWREAHATYVPLKAQQELFQLQMGVNFRSQLIDPPFLEPPKNLIKQYRQDALENKKKFALFVASDCKTRSHRELYISILRSHLEKSGRSIDGYGRCGDKIMPGSSLDKIEAIRHIEMYKFYLSFENTIQEGYVTEKLFHVMRLNVLPVYYGGLNPPPITKHPSYIRAQDFDSPKALAEYLIYLDEHPDEYMKYHEWRKGDPAEFDLDYLEQIQHKYVSSKERKAHAHLNNPMRAASCCRLCNPTFVEQALGWKPKYVEQPWGWGKVRRRFFSNERASDEEDEEEDEDEDEAEEDKADEDEAEEDENDTATVNESPASAGEPDEVPTSP